MSERLLHILYIAEFSTGGSVESLLCLVGGLNKSRFKATILFYSMQDERTCRRFESAGARLHSLYPHSTGNERSPELRKLNLQAKIRRMFGPRVERYYETVKFALHFFRFRMPIYKALCQHISDVAPDLIHLNNGVDSDTPGILAARKCKVPAVCHLRTIAGLTHLHVAASRSVKAFLCISNAVRDKAVSQGVNGQRCMVVP
ncbi:MAG: glycosyltransferase, partial [Woeseiaceae bacterium]